MSPAQGGPVWTRVDTENFRVFTDLDVEAGRSIALQLERDLDALSQAAFESARPVVDETVVVVFADRDEYHQFAHRSTDGVFYRRSPLDLEAPNTVVTYGSVNLGTRTRLLHELTHDLFERNFGPAPTWLNEGRAEYYSTVQIVNGRLELGRALPDMTVTEESTPFVGQFDGKELVAIPIASVVPPSQLLTMGSADFYQFSDNLEPDLETELARTGRYLGAWAFVHLLVDGQNPYAERYQVFLREVRDTTVEQAWTRAFAGVEMSELDRYFRQYLATGKLALFSLPYTPHVVGDVAVRSLREGEVHLLWAQLYAARLGGTDVEAVAHEVQQAVSAAIAADHELSEAHHLSGLLAMFEERWDAAETALSVAERQDPESPRFLFSLLRLQFARRKGVLQPADVAALSPHFERLARTAQSAPQLIIAAHYQQARGDSQAALALAKRAVELSPIDPIILDSYATLLEGAGQWRDALDVQRHAVAFVSEGDSAQGENLRAHLGRLEQRNAPLR